DLPLLVARRQTSPFGDDPDLEEVHRITLRRVELAVEHPGSCGHPLHLARADHGAGPHAVSVLERARNDVREDLHVAVSMRAEARAGRHGVLVDDPQRAEAHLTRAVVVREGEAVLAV